MSLYVCKAAVQDCTVEILDLVSVCFFYGIWPWQRGQELLPVTVGYFGMPTWLHFSSMQNIVQAVGRAFICFSHSSWLSGKKKLMSPVRVYIIELGWNCPKVQKDTYFRHHLFMEKSNHVRERLYYWQDWRKLSSVKVIALLETREFFWERKKYGKLFLVIEVITNLNQNLKSNLTDWFLVLMK